MSIKITKKTILMIMLMLTLKYCKRRSFHSQKIEITKPIRTATINLYKAFLPLQLNCSISLQNHKKMEIDVRIMIIDSVWGMYGYGL